MFCQILRASKCTDLAFVPHVFKEKQGKVSDLPYYFSSILQPGIDPGKEKNILYLMLSTCFPRNPRKTFYPHL